MRPARLDDADRLRAWDEKPHIIEIMGENEDRDRGRELARHPPWRWWFIAEVEGNPIGTVQIIDPAEEEPRYWGEVEPNLRAIDIWIGEEEYIGRGFGTAMMAFALAHCFGKTGVTAVLIDPLVSNMKARRSMKNWDSSNWAPAVSAETIAWSIDSKGRDGAPCRQGPERMS